MIGSNYLCALVSSVLESFSLSLVNMDNESSPTGSILRAVNRVLPLLNEEGMNHFSQKCLPIPSIKNNSDINLELFQFSIVIKYLFLDSVPKCSHTTTIYTHFLPTLIQALSNNTMIRTTTNLSNTTINNTPKICHIKSLSSIRLAFDIIQRLFTFKQMFELSINSRKQSLLLKQLWDLGRILLPYLSKALPTHQQQQQQTLALVEATLSSTIGMYCTSVALKHCPSANVILSIMKQIGNLMKLKTCTIKLHLGHYVYRILNEMYLSNMTWYNNVKQLNNTGTSSDDNRNNNKRAQFNTSLNVALRVIIEQLVKHYNVNSEQLNDKDGGNTSSNSNWALFHCALNVARASMFVLDIDDITSTVLPPYLLEYVTAYMSGTSISSCSSSSLSEDMLKADETILVNSTSNNNNNIMQHPLLTSSLSLSSSKVRKPDENSLHEQRPSKRPKFASSITRSLPMQLNNMIHTVRDGLEDIRDYVNNENNLNTIVEKEQFQQCVNKLQMILSNIAANK
jgi:hypothetical protein